MNVIKLRGIVSLLMLAIAVPVLVTGVLLWLSPVTGLIREFGRAFQPFGKYPPELIHTITSFAISFLVVIHLALNYKMLLNEVKSLRRKSKA